MTDSYQIYESFPPEKREASESPYDGGIAPALKTAAMLQLPNIQYSARNVE
jgi:hypothetical protein